MIHAIYLTKNTTSFLNQEPKRLLNKCEVLVPTKPKYSFRNVYIYDFGM